MLKKSFLALSSLEKKLVLFFLVLIMLSGYRLSYNFWLKNSVSVPDEGGTLIEGVIGSPLYINPILAPTNEPDMDLTRLIFSSLFTLDTEGNLVPDAVKEYSISEDKKSYTIKIKDNIRWQFDKEKLTIDDVLFTVKSIQNPNYKSPLRSNLTGVETEKIDDYTAKFSLKSPYEPFLQNLTFGILPSHVWQYINTANFHLAEYNIKPIGSGKYILKKITRDKQGNIISVELGSNQDYYGKIPYIQKIIFKFFGTQDEIVDALKNKQINSTPSLAHGKLSENEKKGMQNYTGKTTKYFSVFFNPERSKILAERPIRVAVNYLTNKNQIVADVLQGNGQKIETPIPPALKESNDKTKIYNFDPGVAGTLLTNSGWTLQEDGWRAKETKKTSKDAKGKKTTVIEKTPMEITLTTGDSLDLRKTAELLAGQWEKGGIKVNLNFLKPSEIQSAIKDRDYDALLFGETFNSDPDPFIWWHSSGIKDPGLNLALYTNSAVDKLLEDSRQEFDRSKRKEILDKFQAQTIEDAPAIFLYTPYYIYWAENSIKDINIKIITMPADRFSGMEKWYINTKRVWGGKLKFLNF